MRNSEFFCEPAPLTETQQYLVDLAVEYHNRTEEYDRTVCSGPIIHGSIQPNSQFERRLIMRNATAILDDLSERAAQALCISAQAVRRAIFEYDF